MMDPHSTLDVDLFHLEVDLVDDGIMRYDDLMMMGLTIPLGHPF
jgi:hypothetical protein